MDDSRPGRPRLADRPLFRFDAINRAIQIYLGKFFPCLLGLVAVLALAAFIERTPNAIFQAVCGDPIVFFLKRPTAHFIYSAACAILNISVHALLSAGYLRMILAFTRGSAFSVGQIFRRQAGELNIIVIGLVATIPYCVMWPLLKEWVFAEGNTIRIWAALGIMPLAEFLAMPTIFAGIFAFDRGLNIKESLTKSVKWAFSQYPQLLLVVAISWVSGVSGAAVFGIGVFATLPIPLITLAILYQDNLVKSQ